jgi:hypothetical protein
MARLQLPKSQSGLTHSLNQIAVWPPSRATAGHWRVPISYSSKRTAEDPGFCGKVAPNARFQKPRAAEFPPLAGPEMARRLLRHLNACGFAQ